MTIILANRDFWIKKMKFEMFSGLLPEKNILANLKNLSVRGKILDFYCVNYILE